MAGYQGCISLALVCLLLCHDSLVQSLLWGHRSRYTDANKFLQKHMPRGAPTGLDQNQWQNFIRNKRLCRPTQSFLDPADKQRVKEVCSNKGGKYFRDNLCISLQTFTFTTVRCDTATFSVTSVIRETKHLILACDRVGDQCLPVHFEANPKYATPGNNARRRQ